MSDRRETTATVRLIDLRSVSISDRHPLVHAAFDALRDGEALRLITDHEPRPLRFEFDRRYPDGFVWSQRNVGIDRWEVTLRHAAPLPIAGSERVASFFARCGIFAGVGEQTRVRIACSAGTRIVDDGFVIVEQDEEWPYFGFVQTGSLVAVISSSRGREQRLYTVTPGETFGEIEMFDGGRSVARLVSRSPRTVIVLVPHQIILAAMTHDFSLTRAIAASCAQRGRAFVDAFSSHISQPTLARVATALLPFAPPAPDLSPSLGSLPRMTQAEIASIAGTVKEVAARAVAELEQAGAIRRVKGRIAMTDRFKLQAIADCTASE